MINQEVSVWEDTSITQINKLQFTHEGFANIPQVRIFLTSKGRGETSKDPKSVTKC